MVRIYGKAENRQQRRARLRTEAKAEITRHTRTPLQERHPHQAAMHVPQRVLSLEEKIKRAFAKDPR